MPIISQDAAIASFNASQTSQDTAIATNSSAIVSLNSTRAFNYDQQAEPTSPSNGQTWRERNSDGTIFGEWEYIGADLRWASLRERIGSLIAGNTSGGISQTDNIFSPSTFGWADASNTAYLRFLGHFLGIGTYNSSNTRTLTITLGSIGPTGTGALSTTVQSLILNSNTQVLLNLPYASYSVPSAGHLFRGAAQINSAVSGTPGNWSGVLTVFSRRFRGAI